MVSEISISISEKLGKLPEEHPDRVFLAREQARFARHLAGPKEKPMAREDLSVAEAQARINRMVQEDNSLHPKGRFSEKGHLLNLLRQAKAPENSVERLLPPEWRRFGRVLNDLAQMGIRAKDQLAALDENTIKNGDARRKLVKNSGGYGSTLGERSVPFVLAMRDLAIAEKRII